MLKRDNLPHFNFYSKFYFLPDGTLGIEFGGKAGDGGVLNGSVPVPIFPAGGKGGGTPNVGFIFVIIFPQETILSISFSVLYIANESGIELNTKKGASNIVSEIPFFKLDRLYFNIMGGLGPINSGGGTQDP